MAFKIISNSIVCSTAFEVKTKKISKPHILALYGGIHRWDAFLLQKVMRKAFSIFYFKYSHAGQNHSVQILLFHGALSDNQSIHTHAHTHAHHMTVFA